ncbi:PREDICTED: uncharacterized protein LOC108546418 [Eufriesea mexicana]|uniref:uncharacterized protein LOC108546418 n=1 Tax=Eufriesea mexicana TaxID=516756 RepID=UPI00083BD244|nr:PREDICTED: uncharacterized protein LOC108546418 [Eufriesea mexicana]
MDQSKYIEVRIFEPVTEIPTSDTREYSIKTLSTIHECDNLKASGSHIRNNTQKKVPHSTNPNPNVKSYSSAKQTVDVLRNPERPFDIDLLLRYYACNSDMEKSIHKVIAKMEDQVCKDVDQGPLIELGAVCRICDLLRDPSAQKPCSFRFHEILARVQSLIRRCSRERLEQVLSNDPSLKICQHCGVISCSNSPSVLADPCRSPPKTSYFLSTQMFPDIVDNGDDAKTYRQTKRINPRSEQATKHVDKYYNIRRNANRPLYKERGANNGRAYGSREVSLTVKRENNFHMNTPRRIETMVAERENDHVVQEIRSTHGTLTGEMLELDETGLENRIKDSQQIKPSDFELDPRGTIKDQRQLETTDLENRGRIISDNLNLTSNLTHDRRFNRVDCKEKFMDNLPNRNNSIISNFRPTNKWRKVSKDQLGMNECKEEVLRDILYEQPGPRLDQSNPRDCTSLNSEHGVGSKQNQSTNVVDDATSSANVLTYLAGRLKSIDSGKKEFVSQPGEKASIHSGHPANKRSFVLHRARGHDPRLDSEFLTLEKLVPADKIARDSRREIFYKAQHHSEHCKYVHPVRRGNQFRSFTCLMEDDSLENCIDTPVTLAQTIESNTTVVSSSSAENMIREWVKAPGASIQEACKSSEAWKPSTSILNVARRRFWAKEKIVNCPKASNEVQPNLTSPSGSKVSSKNRKYRHPNRQTISSMLTGGFKLWHSKDSMASKSNESKSKKMVSRGNEKRFGKHLFESLKSIRSAKSSKSKETSEKPLMSFGSSLPGDVKDVARRIIYNESSLRNTMMEKGNHENMDDVLLLYRKVLESTEQMDWRSFQRFVEDLHPEKRDLWRDICRVIDDKVKRINEEEDGSAEICIEITSIPFQGANERRTCSNEIVFEMDITLADVERYLGRQLPSTEKEQLDTLQRTSEVIKVRNDDVCDTRVASNQAE